MNKKNEMVGHQSHLNKMSNAPVIKTHARRIPSPLLRYRHPALPTMTMGKKKQHPPSVVFNPNRVTAYHLVLCESEYRKRCHHTRILFVTSLFRSFYPPKTSQEIGQISRLDRNPILAKQTLLPGNSLASSLTH